MKIIVEKKKKMLFFYFYFFLNREKKNYIAIRIAGKVSRYIDASMNRATSSKQRVSCVCKAVSD